MATALDLPLLCLAVLEDSFPPSSRAAWHPTDRAAAFRLEALRELQPAFHARGTELLVHVERDGCRAAVAMSLSAKAALVVVDEHYGVEPHAAAAERAAQTSAPLCTLRRAAELARSPRTDTPRPLPTHRRPPACRGSQGCATRLARSPRRCSVLLR